MVVTALGAYGGQDWSNPYLSINLDYYYQPGNFPGGNVASNVPASLTTHWLVEVVDTTTNLVVGTKSDTATIAPSAQFHTSFNSPAAAPYLTRGRNYKVTLSVLTDPATLNGTVFQAKPATGNPVTVAA